jgi:kynureninase
VPSALDDRAALRERFPILSHKTHLISHSLGAMPRAARDHVDEYLRLWDEEGVVSWHTWLPFVEESGDLIGRILGAPPGSVMMGPNVSFWQAVIASALDFGGERNRVVYTALNFPTVHYVWMEQRRRGAEVVVVPSDDGISVPTERLLDAIDERTLIVPISHVSFRSSALQDAKAVVEKAHSVGAKVLLDCYQSTGTVPFSVTDLGVDFACGGSVKWLCGGPGAAYLYVRPDLVRELRPAATGWFSHRRPFDFTMEPIDYADTIWRFAGGTAAIPALYAARAGYECVLDVGVERIRAHSLRLTGLLMDLVEEAGFRLNTPREPDKRGGTVCFDFPGAERVNEELIRRGFLLDHRPQCGIRASPHFYTTEDEVRSLLAETLQIRVT